MRAPLVLLFVLGAIAQEYKNTVFVYGYKNETTLGYYNIFSQYGPFQLDYTVSVNDNDYPIGVLLLDDENFIQLTEGGKFRVALGGSIQDVHSATVSYDLTDTGLWHLVIVNNNPAVLIVSYDAIIKHQLTKGAIAGIVFGALIGCVCMSILLFLFIKRVRKQNGGIRNYKTLTKERDSTFGYQY
eukprot:TRINITY_DN4290_c0_g1_i2.p1 TRINITY_DN4290_c0_g1~~TRINITY_DN4290_c0_g1_i2.p1  ORF type:complete len:185 (+),score=50.83 TRINITY_DN4290_c0_g1_i2:39-593(+)